MLALSYPARPLRDYLPELPGLTLIAQEARRFSYSGNYSNIRRIERPGIFVNRAHGLIV
jgi:hypothetical protein